MLNNDSRSTVPQYVTRDVRLASHLRALGFDTQVVVVNPRVVAFQFASSPPLLEQVNFYELGQARSEPSAYDSARKALLRRTDELLRQAQRDLVSGGRGQ